MIYEYNKMDEKSAKSEMLKANTRTKYLLNVYLIKDVQKLF